MSVLQKPKWLRAKLPSQDKYFELSNMFKELGLATVCKEAKCPNIGECWSGGTATIMIMGDTCTRGCKFCNVKTAKLDGVLDKLEPYKVGVAVSKMALDYVVLTSVDRDDLADGGASHFAKTVEVIKTHNNKIVVEVLAPDFQGQTKDLKTILSSNPDVFAHNIETVERLTPKVRDMRAGFRQSLFVLEQAKKLSNVYTKSSLMLGLGERKGEILSALKDLRSIDCDVVTFGQYLRPSKRFLPVVEYIKPQEFDYWKEVAQNLGFMYVASGPLVRSSYRAYEFFMNSMVDRRRKNG